MTTELEKEFFKVFGIEPHWQYKVQQFCHFYCCDKKTIIENAYLFKERKTCKVKEVKRAYPEITDRRLLEMICICNSTYINGYTNYFMATGKTKEELKEEILKKCITLSKDINNKIQQLFKENQ